MIAKMQKLHLAAMLSEKDKILDALQKTRAAEIKMHSEEEGTDVCVKDDGAMISRAAEVESTLEQLTKEAENYARDHGEKPDFLKDGFDVSYSAFMAMKNRGGEADEILEKARTLSEQKAALAAERNALLREEKSALPYAFLTVPFSFFAPSKYVSFALGVVPAAKEDELLTRVNAAKTTEIKENGQEADNLEKGKQENVVTRGEEVSPYFAAQKLSVCENGAVMLVAYLKSEKERADELLSFVSFSHCPYLSREGKAGKTADKTDGVQSETTGKEIYESAISGLKKNAEKAEKNARDFYELSRKIPFLKTYADYLGYLIEKENVSDDIRVTERTFLMEAYVPEECVETVRAALESVTGACYFEFSEPTAEDSPPTLLKNGKITRNFETITNMYSVPNSREFDPNAVMGFFYALFMGFIIGDMGYGLIMMIGGGLIWYKNRARESGFKRLSAVFACAGVFAVLWGALFNSLLGLPVLPVTVMPDMQADMWSLAGINVPSVLIISMEIGIAQIFVGYICRAVQRWRRGDVLGGVFEGAVWAVFSAGVFLAIIGFIDESNLPILQKVGGIIAGVSLAIAVLTAGRGEKFFGKFTKGFGAAYGVINYASDVLSYARLYGLLLSGAVVANIISANAVRWIAGGNPVAAVGGVLLMVAGHAFNLAMNLLGAYIHDARLQYVEFFGRFYEGEGELFKPLGSAQKYVYLLPPVSVTASAA